MTNKLFFLGLTTVSLMCSCSSDNILTQGGIEAEVMDTTNVVVSSSDQEIKLSSGNGSNSMRTIIESGENDIFSTTDLDGNMGIFCLAYKQQSAKAPDLNWAHANSNTRKYNVWLNNVEANARIDEVEIEGVPTQVSNICWSESGVIDNNRKYYYPMGGWFQYNFYGYYPKVADNKVTVSSNSVTAELTLDGTQDVLWGKTTITDAQESDYAYSARYFFTNDGEHADEIPVLGMQHALTRLRFKVIEGARFGSETVETQEIKILDVCVVDVPPRNNLVIAQRGSGGQEGVVSAATTGTNTPVDFYLHDANDGEGVPYVSPSKGSMTSYLVPGTSDRYRLLEGMGDNLPPLYLGVKYEDGNMVIDGTGNPVGDGILLPPKGPYSSSGTYSIRLTLTDNTGEIFEHEEPIALEMPENGFEAGKAYWVEIKVNARKEITLRATLAPWTESDNPVEQMEF